MSAIALALAEMGHDVSGVDIRDRPVLDRLRAAGVTVHIGHSRSHVVGCDAVTASTRDPDAISTSSTRRASSASRRCRGPGMLASICARARSLAVAGTHGKTTTTSMLMLILAEAGLRPSFVIGGDVQDMGTGAHWSGSEWFVVEADESDGTHLELPLYGTILTNVETDHLDHFGSLAAIEASFDQYLAQVPGPKVVCGDDPIAARLAARHDTITYGLGEGVAVRAVDVRPGRGAFRVRRRARRAPARRRSACRCVVSTTSSTPPARWRWRIELGVDAAGRGRRARQVRRRGAPVRHPRRRRRGDLRRRLRPPADGDRRRPRRRRARAATSGSG